MILFRLVYYLYFGKEWAYTKRLSSIISQGRVIPEMLRLGSLMLRHKVALQQGLLILQMLIGAISKLRLLVR